MPRWALRGYGAGSARIPFAKAACAAPQTKNDRRRASTPTTSAPRKTAPQSPFALRQCVRSIEPRATSTDHQVLFRSRYPRTRLRSAPAEAHTPQLRPRLSSSSHAINGAKYSTIALASISRLPVKSSSVSCHGWLAPFCIIDHRASPAALLP